LVVIKRWKTIHQCVWLVTGVLVADVPVADGATVSEK